MQKELEKFWETGKIPAIFCRKGTKHKRRNSFLANVPGITPYLVALFFLSFLPNIINAQTEAQSVTISAYVINHVFFPGDTTAVVKLTFSELSAKPKLASISVIRTGTADDNDVPNVHLFEDTNQDGEPDGQAISSAAFSDGLATLSGLSKQTLSTDIDWIICLEIDSAANTSHTAGLTIEAQGITGSGGTGVYFTGFIGGDSSLPVTLSLFRVYFSEKGARLLWTTESEIENYCWIIERKILTESEYNLIREGELIIEEASQPFYQIGQVDGQGTVNTRTDYEFMDKNIQPNEYYAYRLIDISYSGEVTYHPAVLAQPVEVPQNYELNQNYPNPFNPSTIIRFLLPVDSRVTLKIYTVTGQEVITLLNRNMSSGIYDITWTGIADDGQKVASGMYIYIMKVFSRDGRLQFTANRKMTIIH